MRTENIMSYAIGRTKDCKVVLAYNWLNEYWWLEMERTGIAFFASENEFKHDECGEASIFNSLPEAVEAGGAMITLMLLCESVGIDALRCAEKELCRVWKNIEKIRAKQAAKPDDGPLPGPRELKEQNS